MWFAIALIALVLFYFAWFGLAKLRDKAVILRKGLEPSTAPGCRLCGSCCIPSAYNPRPVPLQNRLAYGETTPAHVSVELPEGKAPLV